MKHSKTTKIDKNTVLYIFTFSNMYVKQYNQYDEYCNEEEKTDGH